VLAPCFVPAARAAVPGSPFPAAALTAESEAFPA
jgi:hypothetical protein